MRRRWSVWPPPIPAVWPSWFTITSSQGRPSPIRPEKVRLRLAGRPPSPRARLWRFDDEHGNPKRPWQKMGSPSYLKPETVERLRQATLLRPEQMVWEGGEGQVELEFIVPPHGGWEYFLAKPRIFEVVWFLRRKAP
ncbi:MAG: hypothetical protein GX493_02660 [Firmicutes bacterium]|nr:hypothetical protein [Bacillota bacterium]